MKMITIPIIKEWGEIPEYKTIFNVGDELATYIKGLEDTIDTYNKELDKTRLSELDKEYRINKAIEYIEEHKNIMGFYEEVDGNDLIEILKGGDKE